MKAIVFTSTSGNNYLFSLYRGAIVPIDDATMRSIGEGGLYATPLYEVLSRGDYLREVAPIPLAVVSSEDIKRTIASTNQIIFEVTTSCDLRCKYCCYGDGYRTFSDRGQGKLSFEYAKSVLDYLAGTFQSSYNSSVDTKLSISFYGGEPLLNMSLIRQIVEYAKGKSFKGRRLRFSMTTNGLHLAEHMDFLNENKFGILVSLDGGKENNRYRTTSSGQESFEAVMSNLSTVRSRYPQWFNNIRFNCVYTDISDFYEIYTFFQREFNTIPTFSSLHPTTNTEQHSFINDIYKRFEIPSEYDDDESLLSQHPMVKKVYHFLSKTLRNYYVSESDFLRFQSMKHLTTGTCVPFAKKIFVDYCGRLHPCEKVCRSNPLGYIDDMGVHIEHDSIAHHHNELLLRMSDKCKSCYMQHMCTYCIYEQGDKCTSYCDEDKFRRLLTEVVSYIEKHPHIVTQIEKHLFIR